jgi:hypothetical protein
MPHYKNIFFRIVRLSCRAAAAVLQMNIQLSQ